MNKKDQNKVFIIAEAGVNHHGELKKAKELVDQAVASCADAVKFQTFITEENYHPDYSDKKKKAWAKRLELSFDEFRELKDYCWAQSILFLSSPFDERSVDFLDELGVPAFKLASSEICNMPLLKRIAQKGNPVVLSTGMSTQEEIKTAIQTIQANWRDSDSKKQSESGMVCFGSKISLLYCVSLYPVAYEKVDLNRISRLKEIFQLPVGFSDHSHGIELPIAAVALGANIIEKHLKLPDDEICPDKDVSLEPKQFLEMVEAIRHVEQALQTGDLILDDEEENARLIRRKGLYASCDMSKGTIVGETDVIFRKPARGLSAGDYVNVVGSVLKRDIKQGEYFTKEHIKK